VDEMERLLLHKVRDERVPDMRRRIEIENAVVMRDIEIGPQFLDTAPGYIGKFLGAVGHLQDAVLNGAADIFLRLGRYLRRSGGECEFHHCSIRVLIEPEMAFRDVRNFSGSAIASISVTT